MIAVLAVSADKDVAGILGELEPAAAAVVVTSNSSPRSMAAAELAELARPVFGHDRVHVAERLDDAIEVAVGLADDAAAAIGGPLAGLTAGQEDLQFAPRGDRAAAYLFHPRDPRRRAPGRRDDDRVHDASARHAGEAVVIALTIVPAVKLANVAPLTAGLGAGVAVVAAVLLAAVARRRLTVTLVGGSLLQLLVIASGAVLSVMYILGGISRCFG